MGQKYSRDAAVFDYSEQFGNCRSLESIYFHVARRLSLPNQDFMLLPRVSFLREISQGSPSKRRVRTPYACIKSQLRGLPKHFLQIFYINGLAGVGNLHGSAIPSFVPVRI